ncbi:MAG: dockerin type I domain-containing protein [Proteobacteria bacterium]|nr:dockerin type I domain-containing protein [Pseudomonadota bacterium]
MHNSGDHTWSPGPEDRELGFSTVFTRTNPTYTIGVYNEFPRYPRTFRIRAADAEATFDTVDLSNIEGAEVSMAFQDNNAGWSGAEFFRAEVRDGSGETVVLADFDRFGLLATPTEWHELRAAIPDEWGEATLVVTALNDEFGERFDIDDVRFTGHVIPTLKVCSDGYDNDWDGLVDFPDDPGCEDPDSAREDPACSDGIDNDLDGRVDYDGLDGLGVGAPGDPSCLNSPSGSRESDCITGDVVCDGRVDILDLQRVLNIFGASTGDPEFDPELDLVADGAIDILDVQVVLNHFGETSASRSSPLSDSGPACSLGAEAVLLVPLLGALRRLRRRRGQD